MFRALAHRNFRLYFIGQLVSLNGTWMQSVAQAWLVYRLTQSSFMLGVVAFANLLPVLSLSLFGGVLADRFPRQRLLMIAHALAMTQALVLALLTLADWVTAYHVLILAFVLGIVQALEMPTRHSFLADMVPRTDLSNAIALNSMAFNSARFVGPGLAGVLIAAMGEGWVFMLNAGSFIAVLLGLAMMRLPYHGREPSRTATRSHVAEGLRFAWRHVHVRASLLMIGLVSLVSASVTVLMPVFANQIYRGDSTVLGLLLSAIGVGALLGALQLARRTHSTGLDRVIGLATASAGIAVTLFALLDNLWLALPVLAVAGFSHTTAAASTNTLIQLLIPDHMRGRVMSLFSMIFIGLMPIGSLMAGSVAHWAGVAPTIAAAGGLCLAGAVVFLVYAPRMETLD